MKNLPKHIRARLSKERVRAYAAAAVMDRMHRRGMSVADLARESGVQLRTVYCVIREENTPSIVILVHIAQALGVRPGDLLP